MAESSAQPQVNIRPRWACNICLQEARDPVCTTCGHLFCWPCLYPWVHDSGNPCPVCRAPVTEDANIIAVYGSTGAGSPVAGIPPRPLPVVRPPPPPQRQLIRIRETVTGVETEQAEGRQWSARQNALIDLFRLRNPSESDRSRNRRLMEFVAMRNAARSGTQPPPSSTATVTGVETEQAEGRQWSARQNALIDLFRLRNPSESDRSRNRRLMEFVAMRIAARSGTQPPPPSTATMPGVETEQAEGRQWSARQNALIDRYIRSIFRLRNPSEGRSRNRRLVEIVAMRNAARRGTHPPPSSTATVTGVETEQAEGRQWSARQNALIFRIRNPSDSDRNRNRRVMEIVAIRNAARSGTQPPPPSSE